jgi:hypothetical protein
MICPCCEKADLLESTYMLYCENCGQIIKEYTQRMFIKEARSMFEHLIIKEYLAFCPRCQRDTHPFASNSKCAFCHYKFDDLYYTSIVIYNSEEEF